MVYVPTVRTLADPTKHARLWHELEPLFPEPFLKENYLGKMVEGMRGTTKEWAQDHRIVGPLDIYRFYHQLLLDNIHKLKGKHIIFTAGDSVDLTDPASGMRPRRVGLDYAAESSRLSTELINVCHYLHDRYGWNMFEDIHFVYVNNVICPFHITPDYKAVHSLEDVVKATDEKMAERGNDARFGSTTKDPQNEHFKQGISIFRDSLLLFAGSKTIEVYARRIAKFVNIFKKDPDSKLLREKDKQLLYRLFHDDETIRKTTLDNINYALSKDCYFNRLMLANAYLNLADKLGLDEMTIYSTKGSYAHDVIEIVRRLSLQRGQEIKIDDFGKGVMRNAEHSLLGECDPRALKILSGRLYNIWKNNTKGAA